MENLPDYIANHPWLVSMAAVATLLVIVFEVKVRRDSFAGVSAQDLIRLQNQGALVIDLRKAEEFSQGHIPEAINIDVMSEYFIADISTLDKNCHYAIYCRSGKRSVDAATIMDESGFETTNLLGGIISWVESGQPVTS